MNRRQNLRLLSAAANGAGLIGTTHAEVDEVKLARKWGMQVV